MKKLLILFLSLAPALSNTNQDTDFNICFFELNHTTSSDNFTAQKIDNAKVHVFKPAGQSALDGFKKMMEQKDRPCDGLVISGHHTGNWYGAKGSLKLKDLEKLSCDPKYRDWFSKIQALWLDGCYTITDNTVIQASPPTPDSETARVIGKEMKDKAIEKKHIKYVEQAYALSLDKNTPLSSRYLRILPNTKIYGFNGAAPLGESQKNQVGRRSFIAEHLSYLGQALNAETPDPEITNIKRGLRAISSEEYCEDQIEAWEEVGQGAFKTEAIENLNYETAYQLGCDLTLAKQLLAKPKSSAAQKALANRILSAGYQGELLNLANQILKNPNSKTAIQLAKKLITRSLDQIQAQDQNLRNSKISLSNLLFSNIYETWRTARRYKNSDSKFFKTVKSRLQNESLKSSLEDRISSKQTSSIRVADYIKFYKEIHGSQAGNEFINPAINRLVRESASVFKSLKSPRQSKLPFKARRALALSVADQLFQYNLLSPDQKNQLINSDLFKGKEEDSFTLNVFMKFAISSGAGNLQALMDKSQKPSREYKNAAIRSLTRKNINNPQQLESLILELRKQEVEKTTRNKDLGILASAMTQPIKRKSPQERIDFLSSYINSSDESYDKRYIRGVFLNYAKIAYNKGFFPKEEQKKFCRKIQKYREQAGC